MARLRITWKKSWIGSNARQRATIQSLGLRRLHHSVERPDTPVIRGMIVKVRHMVQVEQVPD